MEKIIFGFSKPNKWKPLSEAIMAIDGVPFSHAYIKVWSEKYNRYLIYQASGLQVNFVNQEIFESHNEVVAEFEVFVSDETRTKVMQFAIDQCGKPYSVKLLAGFIVVKTCLALGKQIRNPLGDGRESFICVELVAEIIQECLYRELPKKPEDMTLKDLYDFLNVKLLNL